MVERKVINYPGFAAGLGGGGAFASRVPLRDEPVLAPRASGSGLVAQGGCCGCVVLDHCVGVEYEDCAVTRQRPACGQI